MQKSNNNKNYSYSNKGNKGYRSYLDETYDFEKAYFFKNVTDKDWEAIDKILGEYFADGTADVKILDKIDAFKDLDRGVDNVHKLDEMVEKHTDKNSSHQNIVKLMRVLNKYIRDEYFSYNPTVFECHFFPEPKNEVKVANMLRTVKTSLDIAIFSLTNDVLFEAIKEVWNAGCNVRVIADDECCKNFGSDIYRLAALGIPVKTDNNEKYHMHHKFAIIDNAVVVTGSFNWTSQAVQFNQENILFLENKGLARQYTDEYEHLWNTFTVSISQEEGAKKSEEARNSRFKD